MNKEKEQCNNIFFSYFLTWRTMLCLWNWKWNAQFKKYTHGQGRTMCIIFFLKDFITVMPFHLLSMYMLSPSGPKYLKMLKSPVSLSDSNTLSLLFVFFTFVWIVTVNGCDILWNICPTHVRLSRVGELNNTFCTADLEKFWNLQNLSADHNSLNHTIQFLFPCLLFNSLFLGVSYFNILYSPLPEIRSRVSRNNFNLFLFL